MRLVAPHVEQMCESGKKFTNSASMLSQCIMKPLKWKWIK